MLGRVSPADLSCMAPTAAPATATICRMVQLPLQHQLQPQRPKHQLKCHTIKRSGSLKLMSPRPPESALPPNDSRPAPISPKARPGRLCYGCSCPAFNNPDQLPRTPHPIYRHLKSLHIIAAFQFFRGQRVGLVEQYQPINLECSGHSVSVDGCPDIGHFPDLPFFPPPLRQWLGSFV